MTYTSGSDRRQVLTRLLVCRDIYIVKTKTQINIYLLIRRMHLLYTYRSYNGPCMVESDFRLICSARLIFGNCFQPHQTRVVPRRINFKLVHKLLRCVCVTYTFLCIKCAYNSYPMSYVHVYMTWNVCPTVLFTSI